MYILYSSETYTCIACAQTLTSTPTLTLTRLAARAGWTGFADAQVHTWVDSWVDGLRGRAGWLDWVDGGRGGLAGWTAGWAARWWTAGWTAGWTGWI